MATSTIIYQNKGLGGVTVSSYSIHLQEIIAFEADSFFYTLKKEHGLKLQYRTRYFPIVHEADNPKS